MSAADGELVVEYVPDGERRRRVRYVPLESEPFAYDRIVEEYTPDGWRVVGPEIVRDVDVDDQRSAVRTFAGP